MLFKFTLDLHVLKPLLLKVFAIGYSYLIVQFFNQILDQEELFRLDYVQS